MNCPHCLNQLPEGIAAICLCCGKPVNEPKKLARIYTPHQETPAYAPPNAAPHLQPFKTGNPSEEGVKPPGLKSFVPKPPNSRRIHSVVRGTGYVSLLSFLAWLTALVGPIVSVGKLVNGLRVQIPQLIDGTLTGIVDGVLTNFEITAETYSDALGLWDMTVALFGAVKGGYASLILGLLLILAALIPLFGMMATLRTNHTAARALLVVSLCLCAAGDWMCYSIINKISNAVSILTTPYDNAPQLALIFGAVAITLWVVAAALYFQLAARSKNSNKYEEVHDGTN